MQRFEELFQSYNIDFKKDKFEKSLAELGEVNLDILYVKFEQMIKLENLLNYDSDTTRDAYHLLRNYDKPIYITILIDDLDLFLKKFSHMIILQDDVAFTLDACLVGSKKIAEYMFKNYPHCDPKNHSYVISYAICSLDTKWVKDLVDKYKVDIHDSQYCFNLYAQLIKNEELIKFYKEFK